MKLTSKLIVLAFLIGLTLIYRNQRSVMFSITSIYPVRIFHNKESLINANNLNNVYEYYLLENLSSTLVKESSTSNNIKGIIAQGWEKVDATKWTFLIDPNAKWSDGSKLTCMQVSDSLKRISKSNSRHVRYLNNLKDIFCNDNELTLTFNEPTDEGLLHELSLADCSIISSDNISGNWEITSGAFFLHNYSKDKKEIILNKNKYSIYAAKLEYPQQVKLIDLDDWLTGPLDLFKENKLDIFQVPSPSLGYPLKDYLAKNINIITGHSNSIHFIYFNPNRDASNDIDYRKAITRIFHNAVSATTLPIGFIKTSQYIPEGYEGIIDIMPTDHGAINDDLIKNKKIKLVLHPLMRNHKTLIENINSAFRDFNVEVEFIFEHSQPGKEDEHIDLYWTLFKGNQRDAVGSWNFLISKGGILNKYEERLDPMLDKVVKAKNKDDRKLGLLEFHQHIIDNRFAIPLFSEPSKYLHSRNVDMSTWNLFDLRPRYYELKRP